MRYVMSDVHGEYALFLRLLRAIGFSDADELYICGDLIDKGPDSVKLLQAVLAMPNAHVIMGNHEEAFVRYYHAVMRACDGDFDAALARLRAYVTETGGDGHLLDWDTVDAIEALPYYLETEDFICVHAGLPLASDGRLLPLADAPAEELLCSRRFRRPDVLPRDARCVFFGHTATSAVCGENKILAYRREGTAFGDVRDFVKVHLDTCTMISGTLGCFCADTATVHYVHRTQP